MSRLVCTPQLGALVIEPLMLGAGGLQFVDPLFQTELVEACRERRIPIVFDEVADVPNPINCQ